MAYYLRRKMAYTIKGAPWYYLCHSTLRPHKQIKGGINGYVWSNIPIDQQHRILFNTIKMAREIVARAKELEGRKHTYEAEVA